MTGYWISVGLVVAEILGVISALHALMSVRTPQGTVAWIVSLLTLPVISGLDQKRTYAPRPPANNTEMMQRTTSGLIRFVFIFFPFPF